MDVGLCIGTRICVISVYVRCSYVNMYLYFYDRKEMSLKQH